jgi:hypothetical protein
MNGLLTVASDAPIEISAAKLRERLERDDPLSREMAEHDRHLRRTGKGRLIDRFDADALPVRETTLLVTDDHPLVEYASVTAMLLAADDRTRTAALGKSGTSSMSSASGGSGASSAPTAP